MPRTVVAAVARASPDARLGDARLQLLHRHIRLVGLRQLRTTGGHKHVPAARRPRGNSGDRLLADLRVNDEEHRVVVERTAAAVLFVHHVHGDLRMAKGQVQASLGRARSTNR